MRFDSLVPVQAVEGDINKSAEPESIITQVANLRNNLKNKNRRQKLDNDIIREGNFMNLVKYHLWVEFSNGETCSFEFDIINSSDIRSRLLDKISVYGKPVDYRANSAILKDIYNSIVNQI